MAPKWLKVVAGIGFQVAKIIVPAVGTVEDIAKELPGLKGKAKQDAVMALVGAALAAAEDATNKDLLKDADVQSATRGVIDAVVALENIIAAKKAAVATP